MTGFTSRHVLDSLCGMTSSKARMKHSEYENGIFCNFEILVVKRVVVVESTPGSQLKVLEEYTLKIGQPKGVSQL